jgi:hypothetical protein
MPDPRLKFVALVAALALGGCSYGNSLLDWATGSPSSAPAQGTASATAIPIAPSPAESNPQPTINAAPLSTAASNAAMAPAPGSQTIVGQKAQQLRVELAQLESNIAQHQQELQAARQAEARNASTYFSTVAAINSRLQVGTTPGNPDLVAQWNDAQSLLDRMSGDVARLNAISNQVAGDSSYGNYLLNEVRAAYSLQGGVEADRDALHEVENRTLTALTSVNQLLNNLSQEITRQGTYVANERNNLVTLALAIQNGQLYGPSLANRSFETGTAAPEMRVAPAPTALRRSPRAVAPRRVPSVAGNQPLVVIRFDRPNIAYQQPLYTAVSRALERKPSATFTIMAVAPNAGTPAQVAVNANTARQNAENVMRTLTDMGLPANRISLAATTSPDVQSNEVRIFVR